jgi:sugar phosphate isomerase/epimerase
MEKFIKWQQQNNRMKKISRRKTIFTLGSMAALAPLMAMNRDKKPDARIGACDWSIGKASDPGAFELAREIGLDGVQVSLGNVANDMHLRQKAMQQTYLQAAKKSKVKIAGLAIGELNRVPYKSAPETEAWVSDSIDVARVLGCKNILLAFFSAGDLRNDEEGKKEVIRRLKKVAPKAEKANVVLGIESWLSAEEHLEILAAVGSSHVKVYYDVANATEMGYDIFKEIALLGSENICEVHFKENGQLLGQGKVDFEKVKESLNKIGYKGWYIMEGAIPKGGTVLPAYRQNMKFVSQLLNS